MIFVTVGTQIGFERLVAAVDAWAAEHPDVDIFMQTGPIDNPPKHARYSEFVEPAEFQNAFDSADLIIGHAGMGTILTSLLTQKRLIIMPRKAELGEHRNDHQLATARRFADRPGVNVVHSPEELHDALNRFEQLAVPDAISAHASPKLIENLRAFIDNDRPPNPPPTPSQQEDTTNNNSNAHTTHDRNAQAHADDSRPAEQSAPAAAS